MLPTICREEGEGFKHINASYHCNVQTATVTRSKAKRRRWYHYERRIRRLRKKKALHTLNVRADPIVRLRCKISRLVFTTCRRGSNIRSYPYDSTLFFYSTLCITIVTLFVYCIHTY